MRATETTMPDDHPAPTPESTESLEAPESPDSTDAVPEATDATDADGALPAPTDVDADNIFDSSKTFISFLDPMDIAQ